MRSDRLFSPLILVLLALFALVAGPDSRAQETPPVKARYTKHEYQIAMRDGVKLFTSVYVPKDASQKYPMKYRKSWSKPEPMKPNEVTHIPFAMPDVNHTFRKGHRIMIHIQSAWFPLVDRNPQKFMNIYQAKDGDFQKATQRIYHSAKFPTHLKISVLKP